jgi:bifunctional DNA-binding transcriptional regulator/antitoxin component of YhaV-PrlF toxin-antitoxin module
MKRLTTTVTSKYQITVPAKLARDHGWTKGTKLLVWVSDAAAGEITVTKLPVQTDYPVHLTTPDGRPKMVRVDLETYCHLLSTPASHSTPAENSDPANA